MRHLFSLSLYFSSLEEFPRKNVITQVPTYDARMAQAERQSRLSDATHSARISRYAVSIEASFRVPFSLFALFGPLFHPPSFPSLALVFGECRRVAAPASTGYRRLFSCTPYDIRVKVRDHHVQ